MYKVEVVEVDQENLFQTKEEALEWIRENVVIDLSVGIVHHYKLYSKNNWYEVPFTVRVEVE